MRINEDFIDRIDDDDIEVSSSSDIDVPIGSYGQHDLKFLFVITKDFFNLSNDDYFIELNKFYNRLFKNFDSLGFIKGYDNVRNVKTISYYHEGETFEETVRGINFFSIKEDAIKGCKENPWFNFKLTFDTKTESVSDIVKLLFGLFASFRNAFQYAFGKLSKKDNITLSYQREKDGETIGKYYAEGVAQIFYNDTSWKILQAVRMKDLPSLDNYTRTQVEDKILDFYTAFYPVKNEKELYDSRILVRKYLNSISSSQK